MKVVPCSIKAANVHVRTWHRNHSPVRIALWALAVEESGQVCGAAIVGTPNARMLDDGRTAEVVRLAADGTPNACSMLLGAAARAARELGYDRLYTYTMPDEAGASLRGAGWRLDGRTRGGPWGRSSRPRTTAHECPKLRWVCELRQKPRTSHRSDAGCGHSGPDSDSGLCSGVAVPAESRSIGPSKTGGASR